MKKNLRRLLSVMEMPLAELKRHTTFKGLNPMAERSVLVALQRRYKVIQESKQDNSQSN